MPAVKRREVDAGLIIHESRFTFETENLVKIIDLGEWWEGATGLPIPLGGICARRTLGDSTIAGIDACIRASVDYAFSHRAEPLPYIKKHAQELQDSVIRQHLGLYVNSFTLDLAEEGRKAVEYLLKLGCEKGLFAKYRDDYVIA